MSFREFNVRLSIVGFLGMIGVTIYLITINAGSIALLFIFAVMFLAGYLKQSEPENELDEEK